MVSSKPFLLIVLLILCSCEYFPSIKNKDNVLAKVHDKYLYTSDIEGLINPELSPQDSATLVSNYVNNWIRQQLLLEHAEKNLSQNQKNFSKQLEDYRNSLIIYEYESNFIRQQLDTVVSAIEIQQYYENNKTNFELIENIVKVNFVQIENETKELARIKRLWQSGDLRSKTDLEKYCIQNGLKYSLFDDSWVYFSDLLKDIPIVTYNQENYLQYNRSIEVRDSLYLYLVEIKDFKIKESIAPLSMHENNIRQIIVNRRKLALIQRLQNDIFENALRNNYFEIYQNQRNTSK